MQFGDQDNAPCRLLNIQRLTDAAKARQLIAAPPLPGQRKTGKSVSAQQYGQREYTEQELAGSGIAELLKEAQKYDEP